MKKFADVIAPEAGALYLTMTDGCNLNCSYCLEQKEIAHESIPSFMSADTARKAIDLYWEMFGLSKRMVNSSITFYGGEPLLNQHVVIESARYVRELDEKYKIKTKIFINTNGTLITREFARKARYYNFIVIVSLDGPKESHNKYRKDLKGEGSFNRVIKGLKFLEEEGVETLISTVLTPSNFSRADDLLTMVERFHIKNIITSPLMGDTIKLIQNSSNIKEYARKAAASAVKYFKEAEKINIKELRISAKKKSFILGVPISGVPDIGCNINSQIVIWPDGQISVCEHMKDLTIGNFDTSVKELKQNRKNIAETLKQRLPALNKECRDCELKAICGGGCAFSAKEITGDIMRRDPVSCAYSKELWNLRSLFE